MASISQKIDLLVEQRNKDVGINPYTNLELLEALNRSLDTALILMKLVEKKGESE